MKRYRYMVLTALLAVAGSAVADGLRVEDMTMSAGESRQVEIELENGTNGYVAFQFEMVLPDGITLGTDGEGKPLASLDSGRASDHVLSVTETAANTYRFLSYSMTNAELTGTTGSLLHVTLQTDEDAYEGKRKVKIQNQVFTERSEMQHKWSDVIFMVEVAVPVITVEDKQREYGEENPKLTYEASSWLTGIPELTTTAAKDSPVGEYPITVERGTVEGKYTTVNGTLTITKAPLTINAGNYTIEQGEPLPTFTATYSGFKNGETGAVLTQKPMLTTTATSDSAPGTYEITVSGAEAQNYDITYISGTLTITAIVPVTVTAKSYTREYGDANPTFEYTSEGATLNGTPTITCAATAASPVGTYPIVVGEGSVKNNHVTYVDGTLTITKAPLTIRGGSYTIKLGDPLPTFTATYDGFKNGETEAVLTKKPTLTTTATSDSEPGNYEVTVSGADADNYDISYVAGTLTISPDDPVRVRAKSYTREYGEENPAFEYTTAGATLNGEPSITCEATPTSPVGTYPIVVGKGSVKNYSVTYVDGTLTITKAPLTISAGSYTIKRGEPLPTFAAEYEGLKNGETEAVLTALPTLTTTATSDSEPGTYEIAVSGAKAQNYDISYVKGTLTIEAGVFTLTYVVDGETYKTIEVEYGTSITAEAEPTKEGYTFSGWSEIPETMPAEDVTVTGSFTVNTYKLTYMIDGKVYKEVEYEYGTAITPEPQPEGDYQSFEWTDMPETMPAHDVVVQASYTSGIVDILKKEQDVRIYAPNGKPLKHLQKGVNIIRMSDGTVRNLLVK